MQREVVLQHQGLGGLPASGFQQGTDFIADFLTGSRRSSAAGSQPAAESHPSRGELQSAAGQLWLIVYST